MRSTTHQSSLYRSFAIFSKSLTSVPAVRVEDGARIWRARSAAVAEDG